MAPLLRSHLPQRPSFLNTITLGVRASTCKFWEKAQILQTHFPSYILHFSSLGQLHWDIIIYSKNHQFQLYNWMGFHVCMQPRTPTTTNIFIIPESSPVPDWSQFSLSPYTLGNVNLLFYLCSFVYALISYKQDHVACWFWCLAPLVQHNAFEIHPFACMDQ